MQEIALRWGCPPVNLLYVFRTSFPKNTSGGLLLLFQYILDFCGSYRILESIEIKGTLVRHGLKLEEIQLEPLIADSVFLLKNRLGPLLHITMPHNIEGQKSWRAHCVKSVQIRNCFRSVFSCIRTEYGDLRSKFSSNTGKYGPEITPWHFSRSGS